MAIITKSSSGDDLLRRNRKYTAFWAIFLMASVMAFWDKLDGPHYVELMIYVFGLYMVGNVGEHWTKKKEVKADVDTTPNDN